MQAVMMKSYVLGERLETWRSGDASFAGEVEFAEKQVGEW